MSCLRRFSSTSSLKKHIASNHLVETKDPLVEEKVVCMNSDRNCQTVSQNEHYRDAVTPDHNAVNTDDTPPNLAEADLIHSCIIKFIGCLYSNPSLTRSVVQQIVSYSSELVQDILINVQRNVKTAVEPEIFELIAHIFDISPFKQFETEFQYMQSEQYLIRPKAVTIGEMLDNRRNSENTIIMSSKKCEVQVVPLRTSIKKILEIPGIFTTIQSYISKESNKNDELSSIFCGRLWKDIRQRFGEQHVLPLLLYYDDFETNNPLGSAAGVHKIGALYFTIGGIPPSFSSCLENMFLAQLLYASDRSTCGNRKAFNSVLEELRFLETNGITLTLANGHVQVYLCLYGVLGDNLGLNSVLGFTETFNSAYFCRKCRSSKMETQVSISENESFLRTKQNYEEDALSKDYGV